MAFNTKYFAPVMLFSNNNNRNNYNNKSETANGELKRARVCLAVKMKLFVFFQFFNQQNGPNDHVINCDKWAALGAFIAPKM